MSIKNFKDEFWFSHASDAKDDPKCMLLIEQLGLEGYGIFWVLVEVLRQQKNYTYPLALIGPLSRKYNTTQAKMEVVVKEFGLFELDDSSFFFSHSLNRRMEALEQAKEKKRLAGIKSGQSRRKKKNEQCSNSVQTMLEHRTNGSELTYNNITYIEEEEKEEYLKYIKNILKDDVNYEVFSIEFYDFIYPKNKKANQQKIWYGNKIKESILQGDKQTVENISKFIEIQDQMKFNQNLKLGNKSEL